MSGSKEMPSGWPSLETAASPTHPPSRPANIESAQYLILVLEALVHFIEFTAQDIRKAFGLGTIRALRHGRASAGPQLWDRRTRRLS
jgi:hypothetical protein